MECNKDEAVRAKAIAEQKLLERDVTEAKKFALKAKGLFPKLDGLSQFLEILDVYSTHEKKINGEEDYYGIFGVDPFADTEILKRKYKRMALSLHPDKNKSVGADGAFKIISQAWSVLSDWNKRIAYNLRLNIRPVNQSGFFSSSSARYTTPATNPQHIPTQPSTPMTSTSQPCSSASHHPWNTTFGNNSQHIPARPWTAAGPTVFGSLFTPTPSRPGNSRLGTSTKHTAADSKSDPAPQQPFNPTPRTSSMNVQDYQHFPASRPPFRTQFHPFPSTSSTSPSSTFWTMCNRCNVQYEYEKVYLNGNLLCGRCKKPFLAKEMPAPDVKGCTSHPRAVPHRQQNVSGASSHSRCMPPSGARISQAASSQPSRKHGRRRHETAVNMGCEKDPLMKNNCTVPKNVETAPVSYTVPSGVKRENPVKRRRKDGPKCDVANEGSQGTAEFKSGVKKASVIMKDNFGAEEQPNKELSHMEVRAMLIAKAKTEILSRINEWETEKSNSKKAKRVERSHLVDALPIDSINNPRKDTSRDSGLFNGNKNTSRPRKSTTLKETDVDSNPEEFVSMVVPDANFHNFDEDRVENSFTQGQVWAAYDDDDGMPRYYALVHEVISRSPFKMHISWLNSKSTSEFGSLNWIASGFTKTTGDFRVGKTVVSNRLNSFSHPVKWKKGARGVIQIFPAQGDVWALYRNWSRDWNETTANELIHKYDLVVVLQEYNEHVGVLVAPLVKVAGFTSVFNQLSDEKEILTIPREQMFRFSHQVPFYTLNGLEAENAPKDRYELDPAALPLELLKMITDAETVEGRASKHPSEAMLESTISRNTNPCEEGSSTADAKHVLTYSRKNKAKIEANVGKSVR